MEGGGHLMEQQFDFDKMYKIPLDERLYKTNLDYFQGIGKYSNKKAENKLNASETNPLPRFSFLKI